MFAVLRVSYRIRDFLHHPLTSSSPHLITPHPSPHHLSPSTSSDSLRSDSTVTSPVCPSISIQSPSLSSICGRQLGDRLGCGTPKDDGGVRQQPADIGNDPIHFRKIGYPSGDPRVATRMTGVKFGALQGYRVDWTRQTYLPLFRDRCRSLRFVGFAVR